MSSEGPYSRYGAGGGGPGYGGGGGGYGEMKKQPVKYEILIVCLHLTLLL